MILYEMKFAKIFDFLVVRENWSKNLLLGEIKSRKCTAVYVGYSENINWKNDN